MPAELEGRVALVTGASRGIGRATALRLSEIGATVAVNYNASAGSAEEVVSQITAAGGSAAAFAADVADPKAAVGLIAAVVARFDKIDILVNNAGIVRDNIMMRMSLEEWDAVLNTDLRSMFVTAQAALRGMMRNRWGRVINLTSVVALSGNSGQANYAAAKAGVIGLTKSLAREYASRNITANAVAPGFIDTDIVAVIPDNIKAEMLKQIPLGRVGKPEEVAEAIAFLASERAAYITGQVLSVNGGMYM
jgi:3-oxoacyl-[acyl-carrier protein] reductase